MRKDRKKSRFAWVGAAAAILLVSALLAGCGSKSPSSAEAAPAGSAAASQDAGGAKNDPIKIKIADIVSNPVFRVAVNQGIFEKYGIDAEIVTFATPAEGINSLFIKQTDVAYGADFPILNAVSKGDYSIIAATGGDADKQAAQWKLFVRNDIQKPEDLKGKKLSTFRGTFVPYLWDEYLKQNGLSVKDTKEIGQGGLDEAYVALKKGEIDAAWITGAAMLAKFDSIEGAHVLTDMSQTSVRIGGDLIAPDSLIREHPQAVANFLKAIDESSQFIKDHPDQTADILFKEVKQPKEATLKDLATNNWSIGFTKEAYDSLAGQKKYMVDNGIIQTDFDLNAKVRLDPLKQSFPDRVTYEN
ncbi:ABC transporter substrate-binding protein [Cohnella zeiphila]|uniref:ABC transporter substrate-binding protein n=1 Tax=Cohnella zeiphila TaxID=2761120 RepID=A0A7X0SKR3_9BACL|nr:ABC transporter substrate-binding protein [Cohnella zeiphila]MBB6731807.1 ABC transporter substrate-binding protein [Cohnella zeiphila]